MLLGGLFLFLTIVIRILHRVRLGGLILGNLLSLRSGTEDDLRRFDINFYLDVWRIVFMHGIPVGLWILQRTLWIGNHRVIVGQTSRLGRLWIAIMSQFLVLMTSLNKNWGVDWPQVPVNGPAKLIVVIRIVAHASTTGSWACIRWHIVESFLGVYRRSWACIRWHIVESFLRVNRCNS